MQINELRPGKIFKKDGEVYQVVDYEFRQQPRLAASIKAKIRNIRSGAIKEENFKGVSSVEEVEMEKKEMQYSYRDGDIYYFIDPVTFDMVPVDKELAGEVVKYSDADGDGILCMFNYLDGKLLSVDAPTFAILTVVETEPAVAGDTARNKLKEAVLSSGISVKVPMFIKTGDKIKVDTRTAAYADRA
jgi:elongation factor P